MLHAACLFGGNFRIHPGVGEQTLEEAVRLAKRHTVPGDIVTLSPACAAFDQFKNFMVRGETYKTLVRAL